MMEALAELYWEQGKFAESTRVYKKVIAQNMDSPRICEWQNKIVRNTLSAGYKKDQVQEIERLGAVYDKVGEMKGAKKDQREECRNAFHDTSKELALIWHKEAQRTKNQDTYALDKFVYKVFLDHFPKDKDAYEMALLLRRAAVDAGELEGRGRAVHEGRRDEPEGQVRQGRGLRGRAGVEERAQRRRPRAAGAGREGPRAAREEEGARTSSSRSTIPEYQKKMIGAFDTYIKYVPDAPELVTIKYRKARIYYEYNHFDEAAKLFEDIVEKHPKHELAVYSANLLLDSLNAQGKTKEVVNYVDKFLEMPELMKDPEFGKQMISLKSDTYDMEGHELREAAATSRSAAARCWPPPRRCPITRSTPSGCGTPASASRTPTSSARRCKARLQLIKEHPKDPLAQKALFRVAAGYHQLAYYSKAAENYEDFAKKFPGEKKATDALGNATTFRIGLGESDKAIADMDAFVKFYGTRKPQDAAGVFFQMGDVYEKDKKLRRARASTSRTTSRSGAPQGGPDRQVLAHFRLGEMAWKASCPKASEDGACLEIKRVAATGRQKVLYDLNKKLKKGKKIKEAKRTQCGPPTNSKIVVFDRNKAAGGQGAGALPGRAQDLEQGRSRLEDHGQGRRGARGPRRPTRSPARPSTWPRRQYEDFLRIKFPEGLDFQQPSQYDTKKKAEAKKKKAEESVQEVHRLPRREGQGARQARATSTSRSSR